jgi:hypothetical protein
MVFYIAYRKLKEDKSGGSISRRLGALGCKRICNSFWEITERKIDEALKAVGDNQPILLKRAREIKKPVYDESGNLIDLGSLIVVAYSAERNGGLLSKTPYIRLCRSVYALPHSSILRYKRGGAFNINQILALIKESDENAKIYPRMVVVNSAYATSILVERVKVRIAHETRRIVDGYRNLIQEISEGHVDRRRVGEEEKKLNSKFTSLRRIADFYDRWLKTDYSTRELMKIYFMTRKLQSTKHICLGE